MNNKTLAAITYITLIGWIVAYLQYKNNPEKSPLVRYHLSQALGLIISSFVLAIVIGIVAVLVPMLGAVISFAAFLPLILLVLGIITALNEAYKPLPVIGGLFVNKFAFLN